MDMILTFDVESGWASTGIQSSVYLYYDGKRNQICKGRQYDGNNCTRERSFGFCQFNEKWNSHITNNPKFHDAKWQIEQCVSRYKEYEKKQIVHKRFFGFNQKERSKHKYNLN